MISTDTNILARAFLEDDPVQSKEAQEFLEKVSKAGELFISSYAILEFVWVLKVKKFSREDIYSAVITLCDSTGITIGSRQVVLLALEKYKTGKADFGDYMIMAEGEDNKTLKIKTFDVILREELKTSLEELS